MTISVKHNFVSGIADGADTSVVRPSNWNEDHVYQMASGNLIGRSTAGTGAFEEIAIGSNLTLLGGTLSASSGSNSGPTFPGGIPLTGEKWVNGPPNVSVSTGNTDLYTVPANKRALLWGMFLYNASGVGNIVWYAQVKISGTYYRIASSSTTTNGTFNGQQPGYVAEAGEIISINTATNNGGVVFAQILEFDNTCKVSSQKLLSLSAGDNTVYTASGVSALVLAGVSTLTLPTVGASTLNYVNSSGGARTVIPKITPSGGSATQVNASANPADGIRQSLVIPPVLQNGDAVVLNTDASTSTQIAWVNVMEI